MRPFLMPLGLALALAYPLQATAQTAYPPSAPIISEAAQVGSTPLTLSEAIRLAFEGNPGLRAAARDIDIAAGERIQAGARRNPELSILSEGLQKEQRTRTVQFSQPLELGGKRAARIVAADVGSEIAAADLAGYRTSLRADVVTAFFDVVAAQERYQLAQESQQLAQRVSDAAARRVIAGKVSPVEETRARVAGASSKIELNQATNELT
ncbi:TolC family protein, partial [Pseudomonas aeruginosa]|uniref:TolC family protein n=1 Tax=Pseudomonas aeruginosa TaxID=287 RepID=UPI003896887E